MTTRIDGLFWQNTPETVFGALDAAPEGLSREEAGIRLNARRRGEKKAPEWLGAVLLFIRQFKNPLVLLLAVAVALAAVLSDYTNSLIIFGILLLTGILGFWQEYKADRAVKKLR